MLNFYNGYTRGQRYVSWKASTKLSMVPRNKAPLSNGSALTDPEGNAANVFPARRPGPMKHYRLRGSTQALANDQCTKCNGKWGSEQCNWPFKTGSKARLKPC